MLTDSGQPQRSHAHLMTGRVVDHQSLCKDHWSLALELPDLGKAAPGQFLHLGRGADATSTTGRPFLRRAFSIGGVRPRDGKSVAEIMYRVRGAGTRWLASLRCDDPISALGPLGCGFDVGSPLPVAWLVAGGVGLPPVKWLAERLAGMGKTVVLFVGARTRDEVPFTFDQDAVEGRDDVPTLRATGRVQGAPLVLATDDGSAGYAGTVFDALVAYARLRPPVGDETTVHACGPEAMLRAVARWCVEGGIECQLCMEREMACGTGTCQSCVVRVRDDIDPEGWRYALCCSEGPVFDAREVIWT